MKIKIPVQACLRLQSNETLSLEQSYDLSYLTKRNDHLVSIDNVHFAGQGSMESGLFIVRGTLTGTYTLSCARCLRPFEEAFNHSFEERFLLKGRSTFEGEEDDDDLHEVSGNIIDLLPYIEEEILVSIPYAPVCQTEECTKHLPQQGKQWKVMSGEDGKADRQKVDPRLAELAKFYDRDHE